MIRYLTPTGRQVGSGTPEEPAGTAMPKYGEIVIGCITFGPTHDDDQPAIPSLEPVRETEIAHPQFPLPASEFTLTPPSETTETQLTLTESED